MNRILYGWATRKQVSVQLFEKFGLLIAGDLEGDLIGQWVSHEIYGSQMARRLLRQGTR